MLRAILNKTWRQHPTRRQLYGHLPPITKTIQVRRARHTGHCWRSKDELVSDVLLWTPTYGQAKAGRPARTYIQQLCEDTGCNPEDLPEVMNDREKWREMVKDIRAGGTSWWWWYIYIYIYREREREGGLNPGGTAPWGSRMPVKALLTDRQPSQDTPDQICAKTGYSCKNNRTSSQFNEKKIGLVLSCPESV